MYGIWADEIAARRKLIGAAVRTHADHATLMAVLGSVGLEPTPIEIVTACADEASLGQLMAMLEASGEPS